MKSTFQAKLAQRMLVQSEGFTLIELLVVIVIVGVLSAVAVPSFLNQVDRSRYAEAQSLLSAVRTGAEVYRFDNGVYPPDPNDLFEAGAPSGKTYVDGIAADIAPNYLLGGDDTGATATGDTDPYDRNCAITYGKGEIACAKNGG